MENTIEQYDAILTDVRDLMIAKNADYGDSWRLMRLPSITDQIHVKVERIITLEESADGPKVSEGIESEYRDILNYCVFALIKMQEQDEQYNKKEIEEQSEDMLIKSLYSAAFLCCPRCRQSLVGQSDIVLRVGAQEKDFRRCKCGALVMPMDASGCSNEYPNIPEFAIREMVQHSISNYTRGFSKEHEFVVMWLRGLCTRRNIRGRSSAASRQELLILFSLRWKSDLNPFEHGWMAASRVWDNIIELDADFCARRSGKFVGTVKE